MGRILVWIVVAFVALFALRLFNAAQLRKRRESEPRRGSTGVPMVQCARCGVYLPRADASADATADGAAYRCAEGCAPRR